MTEETKDQFGVDITHKNLEQLQNPYGPAYSRKPVVAEWWNRSKKHESALPISTTIPEELHDFIKPEYRVPVAAGTWQFIVDTRFTSDSFTAAFAEEHGDKYEALYVTPMARSGLKPVRKRVWKTVVKAVLAVAVCVAGFIQIIPTLL